MLKGRKKDAKGPQRGKKRDSTKGKEEKGSISKSGTLGGKVDGGRPKKGTGRKKVVGTKGKGWIN